MCMTQIKDFVTHYQLHKLLVNRRDELNRKTKNEVIFFLKYQLPCSQYIVTYLDTFSFLAFVATCYTVLYVVAIAQLVIKTKMRKWKRWVIVVDSSSLRETESGNWALADWVKKGGLKVWVSKKQRKLKAERKL